MNITIGDLYKSRCDLRVYPKGDWICFDVSDVIKPNEPFVLLEHIEEFNGYGDIFCKVLTIRGIVGYVRFKKLFMERCERQQ